MFINIVLLCSEFQRKEVEDFAAYNDIKTVSTPTLQSCPPNVCYLIVVARE